MSCTWLEDQGRKTTIEMKHRDRRKALAEADDA
jgi:hypothetical protein